MSEDAIGKALGIPEQTAADKPLVAQTANPANTDIENDYAYARTNLYTVLESGTKALEELVEIAKQSQHPRAYEVLATLIKNIGDTNDKLLNLQKDMRELEAEQAESSSGPIQVSNAIFVGTTAELLDLRNQKKLK